jgi:hypothetical protein
MAFGATKRKCDIERTVIGENDKRVMARSRPERARFFARISGLARCSFGWGACPSRTGSVLANAVLVCAGTLVGLRHR